MTRRKTLSHSGLSSLKTKSAPSVLSLPGLVDVHFHGAWGIDLTLLDSTAQNQLDQLCVKLAQHGTLAFCPTTITAPFKTLIRAVDVLGSYIHQRRKTGSRHKNSDSQIKAMPLGIHLEGPYLAKAGAHPVPELKKISHPQDLKDLEALWLASHKTLLIVTIAPEVIAPKMMPLLTQWAHDRGIRLNVGHTCSDHATAHNAFQSGFSGITHLWNAMEFHHRTGGVLSAALAHQNQKQAPLYPELIIDGCHLAPQIVKMSLDLFPNALFVSDCAPAAGLGPKGGSCTFGPGLKVSDNGQVCVVTTGTTLTKTWAGSNRCLAQSLCELVQSLTPPDKTKSHSSASQLKLLKKLLPHATSLPLKFLGVTKSTPFKKVQWQWNPIEQRWQPLPTP